MSGTVRRLLSEEAGHDSPVPGFTGIVELSREVNDMQGTAEDVQMRARRVFEGILPALYIGWIPRSTQLRTFLSTVAEPLMDSWAETVREEATRLFSCLISEGHAPKDWLEQGGAEVFQKSVSLNEHRAESSPVPTTEGEGGSGMTLMEMVEMLK